MKYSRILDIYKESERRSVFLFGPRATGKSTLLRMQLPNAPYFDLLDAQVYGRLLRDPTILAQETHAESLVIIDEIQKLPALLDEVHRLISTRNQRFVLTGSSARKLKRGASNLLAGRARWTNLFPLVSQEIPQFNLATYLQTGGLPQVYGDYEAYRDLRSYVDLYLREEIQAEALTRNLASFASVLDALALSNGEEINAATLASDIGAQSRTVLNFIEVLEDTLLGFRLPVYKKTRKRKSTAHNKFYFFDVGVTNALCKRHVIDPKGELFGKAFEHFCVLEMRAAQSYHHSDEELSFWRTSSGYEVDLVVGDRLAIEFKSSAQVSERHLKSLRCLREEGIIKQFWVVSQDPKTRVTEDGIEILPWQTFLERIWKPEFFSDFKNS